MEYGWPSLLRDGFEMSKYYFDTNSSMSAGSSIGITVSPPQDGRFPFPNPTAGSYHLYLLDFCHEKTHICYGCGGHLRIQGQILPAPHNLVIVSRMKRQYIDSTGQTKLSHTTQRVYFHCNKRCVALKQPYFIPRLVTVPDCIRGILTSAHKAYFFNEMGVHLL